MKFDIDRMCRLAGITKSNQSSMLREGKDPEANHEGNYAYEANEEPAVTEDDMTNEVDYGAMEEYMFEKEGDHDSDDNKETSESETDEEAVVDVDEAVLVSELRRMKSIMNKSKKIQESKKRRLQEMQLRAVIDQEVKNVLNDLQINNSWVYGNRKPTRSKIGYTHQGSLLKGMGFK